MSVFSTASSPLENLAGIITSPFRSAYASVSGWIAEKQNHFADVTALEEENAALKRENARLERALRQAETDSEENARFRELLNLREQVYGLELETAMVTEHAVTNWSSSLTLNKGTVHGVETGDCVITETGALVGLVSEAGLQLVHGADHRGHGHLPGRPGVPHQGPGAGGGGLLPDGGGPAAGWITCRRTASCWAATWWSHRAWGATTPPGWRSARWRRSAGRLRRRLLRGAGALGGL